MLITRGKAMKQITLAAVNRFETHVRTTKAESLTQIDNLLPQVKFCALIEPHYPKARNGRLPTGLERIQSILAMLNTNTWGRLLTGELHPV